MKTVHSLKCMNLIQGTDPSVRPGESGILCRRPGVFPLKCPACYQLQFPASSDAAGNAIDHLRHLVRCLCQSPVDLSQDPFILCHLVCFPSALRRNFRKHLIGHHHYSGAAVLKHPDPLCHRICRIFACPFRLIDLIGCQIGQTLQQNTGVLRQRFFPDFSCNIRIPFQRLKSPCLPHLPVTFYFSERLFSPRDHGGNIEKRKFPAGFSAQYPVDPADVFLRVGRLSAAASSCNQFQHVFLLLCPYLSVYLLTSAYRYSRPPVAGFRVMPVISGFTRFTPFMA